jgi:hypothetical protein
MSNQLPPPESPLAPKYWRMETGGQLAPAIERLIHRQDLSPTDIHFIRAYFKQWVDSPVWEQNPGADKRYLRFLRRLRKSAGAIKTENDIRTWMRWAVSFGLDPL